MMQSEPATRAGAGQTVRVIRTIAEMELIKDQWLSLEQDLATGTNVFQTYSWCRHWAEVFVGRPNTPWSLCVITVWQSRDLALLCPLAVTRHGPFKIARWLGDPLTQYGNVLVSPDARGEPVVDLFWRELKATGEFDLALLRFVREDSTIAAMLERHAVEMSREQAASVDLTQFENFQGFEDWFKSRHKKNSIRNWRRKRRRLEEQGKIELKRIEPGQDARRSIPEVLELKAQWVKKSGLVDSTFSRPECTALLSNLADDAASNSECMLFALTLDGRPIAYDLGFVSFGRYVSHVGAFHPDFGQFNPGHVLTHEILAQLIKDGYSSYDMMTPASGYKLDWANKLDEVLDFALPINRTGSLYINAYLRKIRPGIKASLDALPYGVRNVVQSLRGLR
ncbi:MAG: GNAT family N-acetyltransferase [Alphaproteobacteria bacterium]|nr:GNAT family N-acetyltransferase [Alphaproteobacteria bacterium]